MKTGPLLGWLGCMFWMLNFATSVKAEWIGMTVGLTAITFLIVGTIVTGAQKGRMRLGIGLSLLAVVFGIGFLIIMLVPEKETHHIAEPGAPPNGGPATQLGNPDVMEGPPSVS